MTNGETIKVLLKVIFSFPATNPHTVSNSYEATVNEVTVPVLPRDLCNEWLDMLNVTDGMICAGYQEGSLHKNNLKKILFIFFGFNS